MKSKNAKKNCGEQKNGFGNLYQLRILKQKMQIESTVSQVTIEIIKSGSAIDLLWPQNYFKLYTLNCEVEYYKSLSIFIFLFVCFIVTTIFMKVYIFMYPPYTDRIRGFGALVFCIKKIYIIPPIDRTYPSFLPPSGSVLCYFLDSLN